MPVPDVKTSTVKVWDPLIRVFHWSLVFFFWSVISMHAI